MTSNILKEITIPTILIEGEYNFAQEYVTQALCQYFCQSTAPGTNQCFCINCRRIKQHQHPYVLWICPEKDYTVNEVDVIFDKVHLALDDHERFFFVLEKAQTLNAATANRLLKVLEEPPRGYTFILLTTNKNVILPTISSRSHIICLRTTQSELTLHPIADYFISPAKLNDPTGFEQELKKYKFSESDVVQICFDMLEYMVKKKKNTAINTIKEHLRSTPGSGSADFFLKRLFLFMPRE